MSVEDLGAVTIRENCRNAVTQAIKAGVLVRPERCTECGARDRKLDGTSTRSTIHGHHDDYSKPLVVRWICDHCHRRVHQPAITRGGTRHRVNARGQVFVEEYGEQLRPHGDDDIQCVTDPALAFARLFTSWSTSEESSESDRTVTVFSEDETYQRGPFVKPHPPAAVLRAEAAGYAQWCRDELVGRIDSCRLILDAWLFGFRRRTGWCPPPSGRRVRLPFFAAAKVSAAHREKCRASALARHARRQQEAA